VMLTRKATETALPSLLGMALDYTPALDSHDARRKIGVITEAEIVALKAETKNEDPRGLKPPREGSNKGLHGTPEGVALQITGAPQGVPLQNTVAAGGVPLQTNGSPEALQQLVKPCPFKATSQAALGANPAGRIAISGYLYAHDFSEVVEELRAGHGGLGMSYEIADAYVVSPASPVWTVTSFTFTGAAVLRREKTAYPETWFGVGDW